MGDAVGIREIEAILAVTDRLGIHREQVAVPLGKRHPGSIRRQANGPLEIVVESEAPFDVWLAGLQTAIQALADDSPEG